MLDVDCSCSGSTSVCVCAVGVCSHWGKAECVWSAVCESADITCASGKAEVTSCNGITHNILKSMFNKSKKMCVCVYLCIVAHRFAPGQRNQ